MEQDESCPMYGGREFPRGIPHCVQATIATHGPEFDLALGDATIVGIRTLEDLRKEGQQLGTVPPTSRHLRSASK